MATEVRTELSLFLRYLAESLDIPDNYFEQAEAHYKAVGAWLGQDGSQLAVYKPEICLQGSFRLGTAVKPINNEDHYDVDLVCQLALTKGAVSQKHLKQMVGNRLRANKTYAEMLDREGLRCWTLLYADGLQFHMDILPAIPDDDHFKQQLRFAGVPPEFVQYALAITDKDHVHYDVIADDWYRSNPRGYAEWFRSRMKTQFETQRLSQSRLMEVEVEAVPEYKVKTPLQHAIQILKRHRDIMFANDPDDKPISIVITTLAALAYDNQPDLLDALSAIIEGMPSHIQRHDSVPCVPNPVNPEENFADKWREYPQRERKFRDWLIQVRADINTALQKGDVRAIAESLTPRFGKGAINQSLKRFPVLDSTESRQIVQAADTAPIRFNVAHRQPPRWPVVEKGWVEVTGIASRDGFRPWRIESNSSALPKRASLRFEARTNILRPFNVYWQVVNTGDEARAANCLRGGFYDGVFEKGGLARNEGTLYTGPHWIECFVVKDGVCVARSGEYVVNIR